VRQPTARAAAQALGPLAMLGVAGLRWPSSGWWARAWNKARCGSGRRSHWPVRTGAATRRSGSIRTRPARRHPSART